MRSAKKFLVVVTLFAWRARSPKKKLIGEEIPKETTATTVAEPKTPSTPAPCALERSIHHTCTQAAATSDTEHDIRFGRINEALIKEALAKGSSSIEDAVCYICGPPAMIDAVAGLSEGAGLAPAQVRVERWW